MVVKKTAAKATRPTQKASAAAKKAASAPRGSKKATATPDSHAKAKKAAAPAKKAAAKKTVTKKAATKKAATKKTVATKKTPTTTAAKKAAPAKKTAAKKTAAKKTGAAKTAVKSAAKKTAAKRAAPAAGKGTTSTRATAAKKSAAAKKTGAKTVVAKKTAARAAATEASAFPAARAAAEPVVPVEPGALAVRPGEEPWTPEEVAEARGELLEEMERLRSEIHASEEAISGLMRDSGDGAGDDQADVGTKNISREHEMSLANNAREMLRQTEHALERLDVGTYGLCESCGKPIGKARMQAFPRATLCVECKQRQERR
ncbi:TraR/DksA C4-type zinc finger protein [Streptomyces sp. RB6PN25]|uniref:TraR/DksA C4-type zinc finger protein n=1 Tax=Streptomyces humicola TaxID=2953240 RepID=A0ABT1PV12_9ACTN|nr:TraR/DksA C4-type zinc finger protein [Streptomyces humicola]MCQ4081508.1 TraR/DksA C4-type zinc finger protein [Streptomyces humicola]